MSSLSVQKLCHNVLPSTNSLVPIDKAIEVHTMYDGAQNNKFALTVSHY